MSEVIDDVARSTAPADVCGTVGANICQKLRQRLRKQKRPKKACEQKMDEWKTPIAKPFAVSVRNDPERMTTRSRTGSLQPSKFAVAELISPGRKAGKTDDQPKIPPSAPCADRPKPNNASRKRTQEGPKRPRAPKIKRRRTFYNGRARSLDYIDFYDPAIATPAACRYFEAQRPFLNLSVFPQPPSTSNARRSADLPTSDDGSLAYAATAAMPQDEEWPELPPVLAAVSLVPTRWLRPQFSAEISTHSSRSSGIGVSGLDRRKCSSPAPAVPTVATLASAHPVPSASPIAPVMLVPASAQALHAAPFSELASAAAKVPTSDLTWARTSRHGPMQMSLNAGTEIASDSRSYQSSRELRASSGSLIEKLLDSAPSSVVESSKRVNELVSAAISTSRTERNGQHYETMPSPSSSNGICRPPKAVIGKRYGDREDEASNQFPTLAGTAAINALELSTGGAARSCTVSGASETAASQRYETSCTAAVQHHKATTAIKEITVRRDDLLPKRGHTKPPGEDARCTFLVPQVPALSVRRPAIVSPINQPNLSRSSRDQHLSCSGQAVVRQQDSKNENGFQISTCFQSKRELLAGLLHTVALDLGIESVTSALMENFSNEKDEHVSWKWMGVALLLAVQKCITMSTNDFTLPVPAGFLKNWSDLNYFFTLFSGCLTDCHKLRPQGDPETLEEMQSHDHLFNTILRNVFTSYSAVADTELPTPDERKKWSQPDRATWPLAPEKVTSLRQLAADFHVYASRLLEQTGDQLFKPVGNIAGEAVFPGTSNTVQLDRKPKTLQRSSDESVPGTILSDRETTPSASDNAPTPPASDSTPARQSHQQCVNQHIEPRKARCKITPTRAQLLSNEINPDAYYADKHRKLKRKAISITSGAHFNSPTTNDTNSVHGASEENTAVSAKRKPDTPVAMPLLSKDSKVHAQPQTTRSGRSITKQTK